MAALRAVLLALVVSPTIAASSESQVAANPIRKVVTMLQAMETKVQEEGKKEEDSFNKFMCWCKTGGKDLAASISAAEAKAPAVSSEIAQTEALQTQLQEDLSSHKSDREGAKGARAEATSIREKEAATYAQFNADQGADIAAMGKAITALEKGMSGFLQTSAAAAIKNVILAKKDISPVDRQDILAFLSGGSSDGYAPASGQIVGLLKQLKDTTVAALADATEEEKNCDCRLRRVDGCKEERNRFVDFRHRIQDRPKR